MIRSECQARLDAFSNGAADSRFGTDLVIRPVSKVGVGFKFIGRLACDVVEQAAGGITPVQGSLWSPQYFYTLHIK